MTECSCTGYILSNSAIILGGFIVFFGVMQVIYSYATRERCEAWERTVREWRRQREIQDRPPDPPKLRPLKQAVTFDRDARMRGNRRERRRRGRGRR